MSAKTRTKKAAKVPPEEDLVWVETGPNRKTLVSRAALEREAKSRQVGPVFHDTDHDDEKYRVLYGHKRMYGNEDLKNDEASRSWYNYHKGITPEGHYIEGPRPFKSRSERREYCRRFGFTES